MTPLFTDFYQLTMAYGYWKAGMTDKESVFNLFFRRLPFKGEYAVARGLEKVIDFIENFQFSDGDLDYLSVLNGDDARPLFEKAFLDGLKAMELQCDLDAAPEGSVIFPHEPILRVRAPLIQCQLDANAIQSLKEKNARIDVWGVGTKLTTAFDQPALEGVYKLSAIRDPGRKWKYKDRLSENPAKTTNTGVQQVRRYFNKENIFIANINIGVNQERVMISSAPPERRETAPPQASYKDLLDPVYRRGRLVCSPPPSLEKIRNKVREEPASLPEEVKRTRNPQPYPTGLEKNLYDLKNNLILRLKNRNDKQIA